MRQIEFTVHPSNAEQDEPRLGILVDGIDLRALIAQATAPLWADELDEDDVPSGAERERFLLAQHQGLSYAETGLPSRHFLGEPAAGSGGYGDREISLLACGCGLPWCWPLLATVTVDGTTVTWAGLRQPFRPQWGELLAGWPLTFDRARYTASLARPTRWARDYLDWAY